MDFWEIKIDVLLLQQVPTPKREKEQATPNTEKGQEWKFCKKELRGRERIIFLTQPKRGWKKWGILNIENKLLFFSSPVVVSNFHSFS